MATVGFDGLRSAALQPQLLSAIEVGSLLGLDDLDPAAIAEAERMAGRLLAGWDGARFRYPLFQFDRYGYPLAALSRLLAALPAQADLKASASAVLWMLEPNASLGHRTPAEVFAHDADTVIALAGRADRK